MIEITSLIAIYQMREDSFGPLTEPQWRMLMDIQTNGKARVSSVCIASGVAATTALRHLDLLQKDGFIERNPDPFDRRVDNVSLTLKAETSFATFIHMIDRHERAISARKAA